MRETSSNAQWTRVSRREPCGICKKPDWCTVGEKGWCCMREPSERRLKNGGHFHPFTRQPAHAAWPLRRTSRASCSRPALQAASPPPDFGRMMQRWGQSSPEGLKTLSDHLGVSELALSWIGAAWAADRNAMAFPMYDGKADAAKPCGIRLRTLEGRKFAVTGSKSGIFLPYGAMNSIGCDRIFICEGPTDTAACLQMGLFAIGRASCRGGEDMIASILSQLCPRDCVVVSDNDGPGFEGANILMGRLKVRRTRIVPPGKDMRAFLKDGGSREVIAAILANVLWKTGL